MASIEELQQSFLNAHTAGDKQAASALAAQLKLQLGQPAPATQPPPTPAPAQEQGGFIPGLMQGVAGAARSVTRPFEEATGVDTGTRAFQESVAREYPTQFTGLESFKEAPLTSATEIVGQQVPFLGEVGLGSLAGRALLGRFGALGGAFIPSALMQYEEARSKQEESGIDDKLRAIPPALAGGALDVVAGPERMLTKALFGEAAREASAKGLAKAAAKGAVVAPLQEVPTEIAQQALTRYAAAQPLTGEEAMSEYGTAGLGALIGAVPLGGAIGAAQRPAPPVAPPPPVTEPTEPETDVDPATILAEATDAVQQATPQAQEAQQEAPLTPLEILDAEIADAQARGEPIDELLAQRGAVAEPQIEVSEPPPEVTLASPEPPPAEAVSSKGIEVGKATRKQLAAAMQKQPQERIEMPTETVRQDEEITLETPVPKAPDGYITGRATPQGRKAFFNRNDAVAYRREIKGENVYDVIEKDDGIVLAPRPAGEVLAAFPTKLAALNFRNRKYPEAEVRRNAEGQWDTFIPPATTVPPVQTPPARELAPAETAPGIEVGEIAAEPATIPPVEPAPEPAPVEAPAISPQPVEETPVSGHIQPEAPSAVQKQAPISATIGDAKKSNELRRGAQEVRGVSQKTIGNDEAEVLRKRASITWLDAISRDDQEARANAEEELRRLHGKTPIQKESALLDDNDRIRIPVRASSDTGEVAGKAAAENGARPSQERELLGQQGGKLGASISERARERARVAEEEARMAISRAEAKAGREVGNSLRSLLRVQNDGISARGARHLSQVLAASLQKEESEITNAIRSIVNAIQVSSPEKSLLRQERPEMGLQKVVGRESQEATAPSKAQEEVALGRDGRIFGMRPEQISAKQGGRITDDVSSFADPEAVAARDREDVEARKSLVAKQRAENIARVDEARKDPRIAAIADAGIPQQQVLQAAKELKEGDDSLLRDLARINNIALPDTPTPESAPADDIPGTWRNVRATDATVEVQPTEKGYSVAWAPDDVQEFRGPTAKAKAVKALQKEGYAKAGYPIVSQGKPLAKIKVKRQGIESETGRKIKVTERADEALKDVDAQIKAVEEIKKCLG